MIFFLEIVFCVSVVALSVSLSLLVSLFVHRLDTVAHLIPLFSDLSDSLYNSKSFALAQGVPENRVAFHMVAERQCSRTPRPSTTLRQQQQQLQQNGEHTWSPSRLRSVSPSVETGSYRCNAAVESRSE